MERRRRSRQESSSRVQRGWSCRGLAEQELVHPGCLWQQILRMAIKKSGRPLKRVLKYDTNSQIPCRQKAMGYVQVQRL